MRHPKLIFLDGFGLVLGLLCVFGPMSGLGNAFAMPVQDQKDEISALKTVAESSEYLATSKFAEVVEFVDQCCKADHVSRFDFGRSVEGRPMVAAVVAKPAFDLTSFDPDSDKRLRILLLGNIHSGECAGKEALLAMLRELASDDAHPWLKDSVIVIAPNYNVDANERVGLNHRPGQKGPDQGMGQRENPQQLDLNRDFVKLESPEARSLVSLIDQFDPHMFIDCHTTNGSIHQYLLTYDVPHNPTCPKPVREFLRRQMMPTVTKELEKQDIFTFYYGNFSRDKTTWATYGHEPRYSTEYVGLRGRLGILSEAYSYASYEDRIRVTDLFVRQCVNYVRENAVNVKSLLDGVREQDVQTAAVEPAKTLIHLNSEMVPFAEKVKIKAFDGRRKKDFEVTFIGDFQPTNTVSLPYAYVIPPDLSMHVERLQMHGVQIERLTEDQLVDATIYTVTNIKKNEFRFQKHNMVTVEASSAHQETTIPAGSYLIRTTQPLGRLAAYALEPETNEGLVTWNFLDPWLEVGKQYPITRIDKPVSLKAEPVNDISPGRMLRLTDIFGAEKIELADVSLGQVEWLDGGKSYSVEKNNRRLAVDAESGAESRLSVPFELDEVTTAFDQLEDFGRTEIMQVLSRGIDLRGDSQKLFVMKHDGKTYLFDSKTKKGIRLGNDESPAELADLNPAGDKVAFVQSNNLKILSDMEASPVDVTTDGSETILNGKLDWVYQEELYGRGNFKAFWWSPDGNTIAFLRTNEEPVQKYTVTDHLPVRGRLEVTAYPKAGDPLPVVNLHLFHLKESRTNSYSFNDSDSGNDEVLISRVSWNNRNGQLFVQVQNRIQSWLDMYKIDPSTNATAKLFRDKTPAWIDTPGDPVFLEDETFLWLSPRSGYNAVYRYSAEGKEVAQVTSGNWEVRDLLGCDYINNQVYFTGSPKSPTQVSVMRINLDGTDLTELCPVPGTYSVKFNKQLTYFLAEHSNVKEPAQIMLFRANGELVRHVIPNRDDRLKHLAVSEPEFVEIPVGEGETKGVVDAMMIKPVDFDESRSYPVIVHIYGGPQTPRVRDRFAGQMYLWHQYLAQQGFVVFIVDNRSSSYRSAKQGWPIYRDLARNELADLESAVDWLNANSWVDSKRIGLWGWSYGGYMTAYALTHCDKFHCGIVGAPVSDWKNYDAIYTERYMDTPQNNPDGYANSSILNSVENLQAKMLLIHGTIDDNVHISNSMQLIHALQKAGKQFELMVYPDSRHAVRDPDQRLHLYQLMTEFLKRNLKE